MPLLARQGVRQDAVGGQGRRRWFSRVLSAVKHFYLTPEPSYADELRAIRLLKANLSSEQLKQFARGRSFDVIGGTSGRRYRITHARQMNIAVLDKRGRWAGSLCIVPSGNLPLGDIMLAQKIALELLEDDVLHLANRTRPAAPPMR